MLTSDKLFYIFCTERVLRMLSPITYTESALREVNMSSMNRKNDHSKQNLVQCVYGHLNIVLRQTCEAIF